MAETLSRARTAGFGDPGGTGCAAADHSADGSVAARKHGYDTVLWTRAILAELLQGQFGVQVSGRTVSLHLSKIGLSYQKPGYRASEQDRQEVEHFLSVKFPAIQRQARKLGADILFEDESGVNLQTHAGRTWGERGETPEVIRTDA